ncbi:MAG: beta-N-acetylhexosaminidase [Oscillospiraceae bacterium]
MFNIIPQPNQMIITKGKKAFTLNAETVMTDKPYIDEFRDFIHKNLEVRIHRGESKENAIVLAISNEIENDEGYRLISRDASIYIYGKTDAGIFWGLQTLKQLLLQGKGEIPDMFIEDKPRYSYRAFMLDSGRYFWKVSEVKRFIDMMAVHKLNIFHWHLTEDQGWRVEIKKYPLLTEKGSKRSHTNFGFRPESGFYTQEEIKEIVKYCHDRFIKVVPEFDIPGHTVSAIACYPELTCFPRNLKVATHWGVKHDILCAGKPEAYQFVYDVIDELIELFPDKILHMGGDEAFKMRWEICPKCQAVMKKEGMKNEEELQHFFMSKVNRYLKSKGYASIMWNYDGVDGTRLLDKDIIWQLCGINENTKVAENELASGRKMYNSSSFPYYLDFPYGWVNLKMTYDFEPDMGTPNMFGVESPLWTEYVPDLKKADYCTYPKLGAFAETAWSSVESRSFDRFMNGIDDYFDLLTAYGIRYATLKQCMPSKLRGKMQSIWFNRRMLHWQGLHNLIDDAIIRNRAKKEKQN